MNQPLCKDWMICTAASFILFLAGLLSPIFALSATLLYSFPSAFLAFERGISAAVMSAVAASVLLGMIVPWAFGLLYFVMFAFSGVMIGVAARTMKERGNLLVACAGVEFAGKLAAVMLYFLVFGVNLMSPDKSEIERFLTSFGGVSSDAARGIIDHIVLLIPYGMLMVSAMESVVCLVLVSYAHRKRSGEPMFSLSPFSEWVFPKSVLVTLVVGFLCMAFFSGRSDMYILNQVGVNLIEISKTIFILQGFSCAYNVMGRRGIPKFLRIGIVICTPFMPFLGDVFAIVGVTDMGFDLRNRSGRD